MESISIFDIFKIGVGPSSSHTMGPWRAAQQFLAAITRCAPLSAVRQVRVHLFGSLAKTGVGHGTDIAVIMALAGHDPVTCDVENLPVVIRKVRADRSLALGNVHAIAFDPDTDIVFHTDKVLPFHPNAMTCAATFADGTSIEETYYSVGGGFVVQEQQKEAEARQLIRLPFPIQQGEELLAYCRQEHATIPEIVLRNERTWRSDAEIRDGLLTIYRVMTECIYRGCHTAGVLPGGLNVSRRAAAMCHKLLGEENPQDSGRMGQTVPVVNRPNITTWKHTVHRDGLRSLANSFTDILKWVSTFALAVNEENAAFGRVVTAPTNGAAGVIPAVMMYYEVFGEGTSQGIIDFMLTAGELGSLFKKGATISAAMGGCQAEIGVSSAMAAGGLTQVLGGTPEQVLMAAEIAMEHHLGMTCDPIGGLVQIPCIERNTMGAIKAITAANIAIEGDPSTAKVTLDGVIKTMWETAKDMGSKYKETAEGGLAVHIPVTISEC